MTLHLREIIAAALSSEDALPARLGTLEARDWAEVADYFNTRLPFSLP